MPAAEVIRPVQTEVFRATPLEVLRIEELSTQMYQAAPAIDVVMSDAFLSKDEFEKSLARERDIYGSCLQRILHTQVERLQESVNAEVNALNARMDKLANAQQGDISREIFQQLNVRMDKMSAQVEKNASDLESIVYQTEARIEKNAKEFLAQIEKNMGDILKMEGKYAACTDATNGLMKQVNQLSVSVESYQVRLQKLEAFEHPSAKHLQDLLEDNRRLQQNDDALQQQHDILQQQLDQKGDPDAELVDRMITLEETLWHLDSDKGSFQSEVQQLLAQFTTHIESYESRLRKLEFGGVSGKGETDIIDVLLRTRS
jgi:chromosome segregation ATPase